MVCGHAWILNGGTNIGFVILFDNRGRQFDLISTANDQGMTDYVGFMVELESNQLGHIVGIVKTYNENQIGLTQATINGVATTVKQYTIEYVFFIAFLFLAFVYFF